jgi:hypothetical protein
VFQVNTYISVLASTKFTSKPILHPVVGIGRSLDKAKRSAALKLLMEIRKAAQNGESLNEVQTPELVNCGEFMCVKNGSNQ